VAHLAIACDAKALCWRDGLVIKPVRVTAMKDTDTLHGKQLKQDVSYDVRCRDTSVAHVVRGI
jgi:hypothetical protein